MNLQGLQKVDGQDKTELGLFIQPLPHIDHLILELSSTLPTHDDVI